MKISTKQANGIKSLSELDALIVKKKMDVIRNSYFTQVAKLESIGVSSEDARMIVQGAVLDTLGLINKATN